MSEARQMKNKEYRTSTIAHNDIEKSHNY